MDDLNTNLKIIFVSDNQIIEIEEINFDNYHNLLYTHLNY